MKQIVLGILAHVDAGKTTLCESMLYHCGMIRKMGRVDHQDAFLDYDFQERSRGITIFSKQAVLRWKDTEINLLDTPGHVDFSAEMERTLQVLDAAVLVINGQDGIQIHTETIWELLEHYQLPVFIFINKMDISFKEREEILKELQTKLSSSCLDLTEGMDFNMEKIALSDEELLEEYLQNQTIDKNKIRRAISKRSLFPCYFGSALKMDKVDRLLDDLTDLTENITYRDEFQAKVYKISRDESGNRLTHVKITGGVLKAKQKLSETEKVDQIRRYSGKQYQMLDEAFPGMIVALKGLKKIEAGEGLGTEKSSFHPIISSYMNYQLLFDEKVDRLRMLEKMRELSEEDPQLHVSYNTLDQQIHLQLMGEVQIEVLKRIIEQRTGVAVELSQGRVIYKETISDKVEGVGHFEPLRHYAEVHLRMEPLRPGSGLQFACECSEDELAKNWQRLILTHLKEKEHLGVLIGAPITDMRITLIAGRAHQKHTEGGDFRQATYRAVRQGLKMAHSVVLEPFYRFKLEIPNDCLSRAMFDLERMAASFQLEETEKETSKINGQAAVSKMQNYQAEVISYTKGKGRLLCALDGYFPCENQEEVIHSINYDSERDLDNPTGSVFCSHGSGFSVSWNHVRDYMHIKTSRIQSSIEHQRRQKVSSIDEAELLRIFNQSGGRNAKDKETKGKFIAKKAEMEKVEIASQKPEILIVDGYNMLYSWEDLKLLAKENLDVARDRLIDIMSSYQGYRGCGVILVFDAYKVKESVGSLYYNGSIYIAYTKHAQTADSYIEKATHELSGKYRVTVATSDGMEQLIILGEGALRMSARELEVDTKRIHSEGIKGNQLKNSGSFRPLEKIRELAEDQIE